MDIAIIPARGGSKRIPRKNIRSFCGKPMIAWSIAAARNSGLFNAVLVSTDDEEIAAVAEEYGAEAPFRRPPHLANDFAPTVPVVVHAMDWFEQNRQPIRFVCCIYPTAPFLQPEYLRDGLKRLETHADADFAFSVTSYAFPIFRALQANADGSVSMFWPENELVRSQDLPAAFHDAGQFYWGRPAAFRQNKGVFSARSFPVVLPRRLVQDIDTPEDWETAEQMFGSLLHRATVSEGLPAHSN
ncbi:MAG: pseudaminic acid cytidylyltransferase [Planctomycetes bacterium]|nr:pseudaminic acid cytidylyltransferase [Planctomycetota bacterium]